MRTPNIGSVSYSPSNPPSNKDDVAAYIYDELLKISVAVQLLALGHIDTSTVAPTKPRDGDIRLADGTSWNPGLGQGVYCYYGAAWNKLG